MASCNGSRGNRRRKVLAIDVAWQSDNSPRGYATYLRPFSIKDGWLAPVAQVASQYGDPTI